MTEQSQAIDIVPNRQLEERSVDEVIAQVEKIQRLMKAALKEGEHFGIIPGCKKPSLLKPGAEKLCFTFRLLPRFEVRQTDLPNGHREYHVTCNLDHAQTGAWAGQGVGSCSTMESKYRWRKSERICPKCGAETIKRSTFPDKQGEKGWYCFKKIGGCGVQFAAADESIVIQTVGRAENPDIADIYNTVLKMAKKRAHIDATITAVAASDIFTQDVEDQGQQAEREAIAEPGEPTVTETEVKRLWTAAGKRAELTGATREEIMRAVLSQFGLEHTKDLPRRHIGEAVELVNAWEPRIPGSDDEQEETL